MHMIVIQSISKTGEIVLPQEIWTTSRTLTLQNTNSQNMHTWSENLSIMLLWFNNFKSDNFSHYLIQTTFGYSHTEEFLNKLSGKEKYCSPWVNNFSFFHNAFDCVVSQELNLTWRFSALDIEHYKMTHQVMGYITCIKDIK